MENNSAGHFDLSMLLARRIIEGSVQGILITNSNKQILWVNPVFEHITQYKLSEIEGKSPGVLSSGRHDKAFYVKMWEDLANLGNWYGEIWNRRKNGEIYPEWLNISAVHDEHGNLSHYVGIFSDITAEKESEERVRFLSTHDTLTGLANKNHFADLATTDIARAKRNGEKCALYYLGIDRFNRINENLGYAVGDELLKEVAQSLQQSLRDVDLIGRFGADQFVVLAEKMKDPTDAVRVANKLLAAISKTRKIAGQEIVLTASIGICLFPHDGDEVEKMIAYADAAMDLAKNEGRNCARFYSPEMGVHSYAHLVLESYMRTSLEHGDFVLHYQPKVNAYDGNIIGVEALIRWNHPEKGLIPPADFIPVAENTGLILPLGEWVIRRACRDCVEWIEAGMENIHVAVNVSAAQFGDSQLPIRIMDILHETRLHPSHLHLEVTESSIMTDVAKAVLTLQALKNIGLSIAVDDFGTGYSSLAYLKRFPIDTVKIDRSFINDITTNPNDAAITRAVIGLGHNLGLKVVAEGVETSEQLDFLKRNDCDQIQGYLFSRPLPMQALIGFMTNSQQCPEIC